MDSFDGWPGFNCLRSCVATLARVTISAVPDPQPFRDGEGFDLWGYSDRLAETLGYRFRMRSWSQCPPADERYWIAVVSGTFTERDHVHHAIACRGAQLLFDPADSFRTLQLAALQYGLELVAA